MGRIVVLSRVPAQLEKMLSWLSQGGHQALAPDCVYPNELRSRAATSERRVEDMPNADRLLRIAAAYADLPQSDGPPDMLIDCIGSHAGYRLTCQVRDANPDLPILAVVFPGWAKAPLESFLEEWRCVADIGLAAAVFEPLEMRSFLESVRKVLAHPAPDGWLIGAKRASQ